MRHEWHTLENSLNLNYLTQAQFGGKHYKLDEQKP